ncbi:DUF4386 domain-containing protein [Phycicoccus sp. CSK15P-2]|uniref:DUF4386 domain-containing protein n=1 Tax=Phycicoccus sp. CSK15P-2 TaxID=2807627 RepID=UPI00194F8340|nr:DUF4386 domain-containing protein [Phycicoccus sp. CSK15P-2]MBM6405710.1 DUF4386 domain-containing protein [Phycicoccus sp. CSK15P-2]
MPRTPRSLVGAGPPPAVVGTVSAALFCTSLVVAAVAPEEPYPRPGADALTISAWFARHGGVAEVVAFFQIAASVPLAIYAAAMHSRLQALGLRNAGPTIALSGGLAAAGSLALGGCLLWSLGAHPVPDPATAGLLHALVFVLGGPVHVVGLGLLVAGVAVPGLLVQLLPRWVAVTGIALGAVGQVCTLALLVDPLAYLVPLARFGGLAWLVLAALLLPRNRLRTGSTTARRTTAPGT